jgi:hypothetical protein
MNKVLRFFTATIFMIAGFALVAGNAFGQNDPSSSAQNPDPSAASPAPAKQTAPKKVWTNDDGRFHARPSPSADTSTKAAGAANKPKPNNNGKNAGWYRGQITKLQGQISPLDDKIAQLQAALNGQTTNAPRTYGWSKPDDWRDALARYQKQREDIQAKISALEDEARHNGVPESEIP